MRGGHPIYDCPIVFGQNNGVSHADALEDYGDAQVGKLLEHYSNSTLFTYLGGEQELVLREWSRLKAYVTRTPSLYKLKYAELYARLFRPLLGEVQPAPLPQHAPAGRHRDVHGH